MPAYIVKEAGQYSIFSTVVMANICPAYPSLELLELSQPRAHEILLHMPAADIEALRIARSVSESTYFYDSVSERVRLMACAVDGCGMLVSRRIGNLPPLCEGCVERARAMFAPA